MKAGDLVKHIPSNEFGLIIAYDDCVRLLVMWCDDIGEIEDVGLYEGEWEVIGASR